MWTVVTTTAFNEWFTSLGDAEQGELAYKIDLLRQFGPRLARPHADTLAGSKFANMKELRGKTAGALLRVAFAFDPDRRAILLVGGNKAGVGQRQFYKSLIKQADRIFAEYLASRE